MNIKQIMRWWISLVSVAGFFSGWILLVKNTGSGVLAGNLIGNSQINANLTPIPKLTDLVNANSTQSNQSQGFLVNSNSQSSSFSQSFSPMFRTGGS